MSEEKEIDIVALDYPSNVRTRLGMFLGSPEKPDVCLREIVDNSIDEIYNSQSCNLVDIQIVSGKAGGWYVVADNGRGIPIIMDEAREITKTQLAMTVINAGSKFKNDSTSVSIGANGTGASAVNAVSTSFIVLSRITADNYNKSIEDVKTLWKSKPKDEPFYVIEFHEGIKVFESALVKSDIEAKYEFSFPAKMSTVTAFKPDPTIWKSIVANYNKKSLSYLKVILDRFYKKDVHIVIDGTEMDDFYQPYQFEFIKEVVSSRIDGSSKTAKFYVNFEMDKLMSVCDQSGSVNSLSVNMGAHINWTSEAYAKALQDYYNIDHDCLINGMKINIICMCPNVDYSSQTKERCVKLDDLTKQEVIPELQREFRKIFKANKEYFDEHVSRLNEYASSLNRISAIQKVKQLVGTVEGGNRVRSKIPASVKDAASNDREKCSLFICEGKSAGSTLIKARDPLYHAIIPLRGIPMNAVNADLESLMNNVEMKNIITCIGAGVNEYFDVNQARYGKIILTADSDCDGCKINSMLLGMIAKKMTFLIDRGMVYIANAPLYQQGDILVYPGEDYTKKIDVNKPFRRYKGLGEINVTEARQFFFNEDTRNLLQVTPNNYDRVFDLLTSSFHRKDLMVSKQLILDPYNTGIL